jgi:PIN domain nuclease of toxin-antitoxin system
VGSHAVILIDTHVLIWLLDGNERLGLQARGAIAAASPTRDVHVSAITPWEVALLSHKGRLNLRRDPLDWIEATLALPGIALAAIEPEIAVNSVRLPGSLVGDPADRFLVATARFHGWSLVTADRPLLAYGGEGHVQVIDASL